MKNVKRRLPEDPKSAPKFKIENRTVIYLFINIYLYNVFIYLFSRGSWDAIITNCNCMINTYFIVLYLHEICLYFCFKNEYRSGIPKTILSVAVACGEVSLSDLVGK